MKMFDHATSSSFTTYKTPANADKAMAKAAAAIDLDLHDVQYLVMVTKDGRFKPVITGYNSFNKRFCNIIEVFHAMSPVACVVGGG